VSVRLAAWIYQWRLPLTAFIIAGALLSIPRANITHIDNDITAWCSKQDPVYQDYERFRAEFGGTRSLIIAFKAETPDVLFATDTLAFIQRVTGDIERVETVERVASLATATIVEATPDGGLDVHRLIDDSGPISPADVRRRALADDLIRGDLVSNDATVTALVVTFDENRIDSVRAGVIQRIHDVVDPQLPRGVTAFYNGSLEISETYNRVTLANQQRFTPPILLFTVGAIFLTFRSWRKTLLSMIAVLISVLWTLGLYSLMGFTYNVLSQIEGYGFAEAGTVGARLAAGDFDRSGGSLPLQTHGGLLSEGYLHGMNHVYEAVEQIRGEAGHRQVERHDTALVTGQLGYVSGYSSATVLVGA